MRIPRPPRPPWQTDFYRNYLASANWAVIREGMLWLVDYSCEACGAGLPLEVHHVTYDRLGDESLHDLQVLCPPCHTRADSLRVAHRQRSARFNGWATKVYGDDAFYWPDDAEERFDEWLERHD